MESSKAEERRTEIVPHDCEKLKTRSERQKLKMGFIRDLVTKELGSSGLSLNLDDDRITEILSTFKNPTHPPYALMIHRAIEGLNEERGSCRKTISEFITKSYENLPLAHDAILEYHLNILHEKGEIICRDNELYTTAANSTRENDSVVTKQKKRKRGRGKGIGNVKQTKVNSKARKEPNVERVEVIIERNSTISDNGVLSSEERVRSSEEVPRPKKPCLTLQEKLDQSELQRRKLRSHAHLGVKPETAIIISEPLLFSDATNHQPETTKDQHQDEPPLKRCLRVGPAVPATQRVLRSNSRGATSETAIVIYEPALVMPPPPLPPPPLPPPPLPEKRDGRGRLRKLKMTEENLNMKAVLLCYPREGEGEDGEKKKKHDGRGRPSKLKTTTTEERPNALRAPQTGAGKKRDGRGRPRKPKSTTTTEDRLNTVLYLWAPQEAAEKKKKPDGRGRPRKVVSKAVSPRAPREGVEKKKKQRDGRGRPRKLNTTTTTTTEDKLNRRGVSPWVPQEGEEKKKKRDGRGRPRKLNPTTTTTTGDKLNMRGVSPWAPQEGAETKKKGDGRGRPRKLNATTTTTTEDKLNARGVSPLAPQEGAEKKKKRDGRGRPRKLNTTPTTTTTEDKPNTKAVSPGAPREEAEKKKRHDGRGRPRKTEATTIEEKPSPVAGLACVPQEGEEEKKKKRDGRGRPRKVTPPTKTEVKPAVAVGTEFALFKPWDEQRETGRQPQAVVPS